jgi:hypothetical protein
LLLPWSPLKPGYRVVRYAGVDVYLSKLNEQANDYGRVDLMMREAEVFPRLKFVHRVKVIACKSWSDCERALPWLHVRSLGGVTLATGDVITSRPE